MELNQRARSRHDWRLDLDRHRNQNFRRFRQDVCNNWRQCRSPQWPGDEQTKRQPHHSEKDSTEHVGEVMRSECDAAETNQRNDETRRRKNQDTAAATFNHRNQEESELSVKQGRADTMTAGETVTRPIDKPAVHERTMSMDQNLHPFIQEHSPRDGDYHGEERRPPPFEDKKQDGGGKDDRNPFTRAKFGNAFQHADEGGREMSMEPESGAVIDAGERIC